MGYEGRQSEYWTITIKWVNVYKHDDNIANIATDIDNNAVKILHVYKLKM